VFYTKSGVPYTAKPTSSRATPYQRSVAMRYSRGASRPARSRTAAKAARILANPETKYFDCGISAGVTFNGGTWADSEVPCDNYVTSSGAVAAYTDSCLLPTAQGSGYGQVNGNRYKLRKIRARGRLYLPISSDQADMGTPAQVRLMMIMDTQPNGAQAQGEDIMQDFGTAQENVFSWKRVADNSGRFRILKDKFCVLQPATAGTDGTNTNSLSWEGAEFSFQYKPKVPLTINIKSGNATPTVAGAQSCNIFLLAAATKAAAVVSCNVIGTSRAYYSD